MSASPRAILSLLLVCACSSSAPPDDVTDDSGRPDDSAPPDDTGDPPDSGIGPPALLKDGYGAELTVYRACNDLLVSLTNESGTVSIRFEFHDSPIALAEANGGTKTLTYSFWSKDVAGTVRIGKNVAGCDCACDDIYDDISYDVFAGTLSIAPQVVTGSADVSALLRVEIMDDLDTGGWHGTSARPGHLVVKDLPVTRYP